MNVAVVSWKPYSKGKLVGFFDLRLDDAGIIIRGCCLFHGEKGPFIGFPSKAPKQGTGTNWTPYVEFTDKGARDRLQPAILAALEAFRGRQDVEAPARGEGQGEPPW